MSKHFSSFEEIIADEDFLASFTAPGSSQALRWQEWLDQHPEYLPLTQEAETYLKNIYATEQAVPAGQTDLAYSQFLTTIRDSEAPVIPIKSAPRKRWMLVAAAMLLIVAGTFTWLSRSAPSIKYNTQYGQVNRYTLPDGSEVMLNANSHLAMKKWKENKDREVWLDGEAFFHIKKTSQKNRFIVHVNDLDVIVTGTQFNVMNRDGETAVLLKEGSVTLRTADGREIRMQPGDYITIRNRQPEKQQATQEKVLAWTESKLIFDNTLMTEAQKIISQHYGVKVSLEGNVAQESLSGILPNDNLDVLLEALETAKNFRIEKKNNDIVISDPQQ